MNSLRHMMETTFAAAAFAERNLNPEARELLGQVAQSRTQDASARTDARAKRQRPSLKA